ncbi:MAG TPA: hypothetical protein VKL40_08885 [Candidatus Angelobacter sp.]|nr:hypothetical protein [Candidatus Angelobacter sp.]
MKLGFCFLSSLVAVLLAPADTFVAQQTGPRAGPLFPTVTYDCLWAAATPQEYHISVTSAGSASYLSRNPEKPPDANGVRDEDYVIEFTMSAPNRTKVFALAEQAKFFDGQFDYTKHAIANTGRKTLTYADSARHFQTTYNWSENTAIDQLTKIFGGISSTVEHGRKLQFLRRFDKLGLEAELKAMESLAESHDLAEIQIIAPLLESIANDPSVLNIARQRARRLLVVGQAQAAGGVKVVQ